MEAGLTDHDWTLEDLILEDLQIELASSGFGEKGQRMEGPKLPSNPQTKSSPPSFGSARENNLSQHG
jgi:hypothetical protein